MCVLVRPVVGQLCVRCIVHQNELYCLKKMIEDAVDGFNIASLPNRDY